MLKPISTDWKRLLLLLVILAAVALIATMQSPLPEHLTKIDYRAYWGASRLLADSENFSDPERMLQTQRQLTGSSSDEALMTWNPPWLLGWFLPFAMFSFERASWLWFLTSIILIYVSVVLLWRVFSKKQISQRKIWIPFVLIFVYIPTLTTLLVGQITSLILFGLAGFLFFHQRRQSLASGACLSLTTVKPQLVFVTLPILLLELASQRRWRAFAGLLTPLLIGSVLVFLLRPTFVPEYINSVTNGALTRRIAPTLPFLLSYATGLPLLRFIGVLVIPVVGAWWRYRRRHNPFEMQELVIITLLLSILFTPFAWSFDALVIILPLTQLAVWTAEGEIGRFGAITLLVAFIIGNAIAFYQRSLQVWDWEFYWFPVVMVGLYVWGRWLLLERRK